MCPSCDEWGGCMRVLGGYRPCGVSQYPLPKTRSNPSEADGEGRHLLLLWPTSRLGAGEHHLRRRHSPAVGRTTRLEAIEDAGESCWVKSRATICCRT